MMMMIVVVMMVMVTVMMMVMVMMIAMVMVMMTLMTMLMVMTFSSYTPSPWPGFPHHSWSCMPPKGPTLSNLVAIINITIGISIPISPTTIFKITQKFPYPPLEARRVGKGGGTFRNYSCLPTLHLKQHHLKCS